MLSREAVVEAIVRESQKPWPLPGDLADAILALLPSPEEIGREARKACRPFLERDVSDFLIGCQILEELKTRENRT